VHRELLAELGCVIDIDLYQLEPAGHLHGGCSSVGLTIGQGAHQVVQGVHDSGTAAFPRSQRKSSSVASTIQGSGALRLPQRGLPSAAAGTRFLPPQRT
jgi:hypothetical protein